MVATLSFSGKSLRCEAVIDAMTKSGIYGDVSTNVTINPDGSTETGCRVLVANKNAEERSRQLWMALRDDGSVQCAHIKIESMKSGCTHDVFAPSRCPTAGD